jgi:hypothetical protein
MTDSPKLPDGVKLVKSDIFYPTGNWSIRRGELVPHRELGWKNYYEAVPTDGCYFKTAEEAVSFFERFEKQPHRANHQD